MTAEMRTALIIDVKLAALRAMQAKLDAGDHSPLSGADLDVAELVPMELHPALADTATSDSALEELTAAVGEAFGDPRLRSVLANFETMRRRRFRDTSCCSCRRQVRPMLVSRPNIRQRPRPRARHRHVARVTAAGSGSDGPQPDQARHLSPAAVCS